MATIFGRLDIEYPVKYSLKWQLDNQIRPVIGS
jgi:hypothetical protein